MWPWMWIFYAPTYRWPWSGDWQQTVDTNAATPRSSANPELEHLIQTRIASYGRQIGWLNDVLLSQQPGATEADFSRASESLEAMRRANLRIRALKASCEPAPSDDLQAQARAMALRLEATDPHGYAAFRQVLGAREPG